MKRHELARRVGWGIADQALSSLTNFALGVWVARAVSSRSFGAFSLIFASYLVAWGISRAISSDPMVVRFSAVARSDWTKGAAEATGAALLVGVGLGVLCVVGGLVAGGSLTAAYVVLGVALPGLLLQDAWRWCFFALGEAKLAFTNDLLWGVLLVPAFAVAGALAPGSIMWLLVAWGSAASVAAVVGSMQSRVIPEVRHLKSWLSQNKALTPRFLGEFVATIGAAQLAVLGVGAYAGLEELGSLRGAQVIVGPLNVLMLGGAIIAIPEGVRAAKHSLRRVRDVSTIVSGVLVVAALGWGLLVILLVPDRLGVEFLGATWHNARGLVLPVAIAQAGFGGWLGGEVGLKALLATRRGLKARLFLATLTAVLGVSGALVAGAIGAAWGLALAACLGAVMYWRQLFEALAEAKLSAAGPGAATIADLAAAEPPLR